MLKKYKHPLLLVLISLILYLPSFTNFFAADDWFHLRVSNISSVQEFVNFFLFTQGPQSAGSYRPLATQFFFFVGQNLFGLNPLPYHLITYTFFLGSLWLIYKVGTTLLPQKKLGLLAVYLYLFSATNFTKLYFLSAFQETLMTFFVLLCIYWYLKQTSKYYFLSIGAFMMALLSKETAAVTPIFLLGISFYQKKISLKTLIPFFIILFGYIYARFYLFGKIEGESYIWNFSLRKILNTLLWYTLWCVGAPELLVDYVSSGLKVLPRFFTDFPSQAKPLLLLLCLTLSALGIQGALLLKESFVTATTHLKTIRKIWQNCFLLILLTTFFVASLGPILFLPWHKFTLELTLPMVWFSYLLALILFQKNHKFGYLTVLLFILLNVFTNVMTYQTHYSTNRAKVSQKVYHYLQQNHPQKPTDGYLEFINDVSQLNNPKTAAQELSYPLSGSEMFRVFYDDPNYKVYFEGLDNSSPANLKRIPIESSQFLK